MNNAFVTQLFDWSREPSKRLRAANRVLEGLGFAARLQVPYADGEMTLTEHRINLFHLLSQVLEFDVQGDVVEIGCSAGQTSVLLQMVIDGLDAERQLHVYDAFEGPFRGWDGSRDDSRGNLERMLRNFADHDLASPRVHAGWFEETLPTALSEKVAFANVDIADRSQDDLIHEKNLLHCLESLYPRLSRGAICVLADYADFEVCPVESHYPAVKKACDRFFADKPESVSVLWGPLWTQGSFRKR